jgi:hypothetical protein
MLLIATDGVQEKALFAARQRHDIRMETSL